MFVDVNVISLLQFYIQGQIMECDNDPKFCAKNNHMHVLFEVGKAEKENKNNDKIIEYRPQRSLLLSLRIDD